MKLHCVVLGRLRVVVEDVVKGDLVDGLEEVCIDLFASILQVSPPVHDGFHPFLGQFEGAHRSFAHDVSVPVISSDHEGLMVEDGAGAEAFNDELFILTALVVGGRQLHDARLDDNHSINFLTGLEHGVAFLVGLALHVVHELLLGNHREVLEVADFVALHLQEGA